MNNSIKLNFKVALFFIFFYFLGLFVGSPGAEAETLIQWDIIDVDGFMTSIDLEYSTDSGLTWNGIAYGLNTSIRDYDWNTDIIIFSEEVKIRVIVNYEIETVSYSVFDKNNTKSHMDKKMFFDEAVDVARYDQVKYSNFDKITDKQLGFFWRPDEVDLGKDRKDFSDLTAHEQHIFTSNLLITKIRDQFRQIPFKLQT